MSQEEVQEASWKIQPSCLSSRSLKDVPSTVVLNCSDHPRTNDSNVPDLTGRSLRSSSGCWTCRSRKVKCDESTPVCRNCNRLGRGCDYSIKITIRDDTHRVVRRMQHVSLVGNSVWDPTSPARIETNSPAVIDDFPPFASLATDEDRERKAECSIPGTYNVIFNVDSFQHLWRGGDSAATWKEVPISASQAGSLRRGSVGERCVIPNDPNIVVLRLSEDLPNETVISEDQRPPISLAPSISEGPVSRYEQHFRDVVWKKLFPYEHTPHGPTKSSSIANLEATAASFPPLFLAMIALSVLSLARLDDAEPVEALNFYQQAFSSLQTMPRTPEDLPSDGAFWTSFILLVYEIAVANPSHSHLWAHHLSMLAQIWRVRRDIFSGEKHQSVVWWIYEVDLNALFNGFGSGEFVCAMLSNDIIPPPFLNFYPLGLDSTTDVHIEELDTLPKVWRLYFAVTMFGAQLALLAQEFRRNSIYTIQQREREIQSRKCRVVELQHSFRQISTACLPARPKRLFEQAWTLYQACTIYSYTSMWPTQQMDTSPSWDTEICLASNEILRTANDIISAGRFDCRFLVFPLVMAGFASRNGTQKLTVLELLGAMEQDSIGRNTEATRKALEGIYERQNERFMYTGHGLDVDWIDIMAKEELSVVCFGL